MVGLEAFGEEFKDKYEKTWNKDKAQGSGEGTKKVPYLKLSPEHRKELIKYAKKTLEPDKPQFHYPDPYGRGDLHWHAILCETKDDLELKLDWQYTDSFVAYWHGSRLYCNVKKGLIQVDDMGEVMPTSKIKPNTPYLLVGFLKEKEGKRKGVKFNVLRVDEIIEMSEIAAVGD